MMRSMYSAISGLRAQQTAMDVIGNNIANVNTAGFKASVVNFTDLFYQTLQQGNGQINPSQVGYGSRVGSIDKDMSTNGATYTDNPLDLYIDGEGFFAVNTMPDGSGTTYYTRLGNFHIDASGMLVDSSGNYVMGVQGSGNNVTLGGPINLMNSTFHSSTGTIIKITPATYKQLSDIQINTNGTISASLADQVGVLSLDSPAAIICDAAYTNPIKVQPDGTLLDSAAIPATVTFSGGKTLNLIGSTVEDANGNGRVLTASDLGNIDVNGITVDGVNRTLSIHFAGDPADVTYTVVNPNAEDLTVAVATFVNPDGLYETGNSYYNANISSGVPSYIRASDGNSTKIRSGALEMSNVDLSKEFTNMIVTQRGFQANSRVITVSDTMLDELVNLKRS